MPAAEEITRGSNTAAKVLLPMGALLCLMPFMSSGLGLGLGLLLALAVGNPYADVTKVLTKRLLTTCVIALGAGMNLVAVLQAGASGLIYTVVGIAVCLGLGLLLTKLLKVPHDSGVLISVGTAICGGSAIAAVAPAIRAKPQDISMAMATVFVLNSLALFIFPPVGHWVGLSPHSFGLWAALAIHDTSSVVGAALQFDPASVETATTIKLARALWIVPVALGFGLMASKTTADGQKTRPTVPWFIFGFVAAAALVSWVPALAPYGHWVAKAGKQGLVLTLFLIGAGLSRQTLKTVGPAPAILGVVLWLSVGSASLGAIWLGWVR